MLISEPDRSPTFHPDSQTSSSLPSFVPLYVSCTNPHRTIPQIFSQCQAFVYAVPTAGKSFAYQNFFILQCLDQMPPPSRSPSGFPSARPKELTVVPEGALGLV